MKKFIMLLLLTSVGFGITSAFSDNQDPTDPVSVCVPGDC